MRSQDSDVFEDNSDDPFADNVAAARRQSHERLTNVSPTIRASTVTYIDQPFRADSPEMPPPASEARRLSLDPFMDPAAPLFPSVGNRNRLSAVSSQVPPSPTSDASSTVSIISDYSSTQY